MKGLVTKIEIVDFLNLSKDIKIIDVRAPIEYERGHIPGAVNIPLFNNKERSEIGTAYKQKSEEDAIFLALEYVGPRMKEIATEAKKLAGKDGLLIHCWRGGMRSTNMAWLFSTVGINCRILEGGYKSYRQYINSELAKKLKIIVLSGFTGSGKTEVLHELEKLGEQILDLEALANHKGSAFGGIGQNEQMKTEQFENYLYTKCIELDNTECVWIEDESKSIGKVFVPDALFLQMRMAPVLKINVPKELRVNRLVKEYTNADKEELICHIDRIKKRLGPNETKLIIEAVKNNEMDKAVDLCLVFYDKAYAHGLSKRDLSTINEIDVENDDPYENALRVLNLKESKGIYT